MLSASQGTRKARAVFTSGSSGDLVVDPAPYAERKPGLPLAALQVGSVTPSAHQALSRGWSAVRERGVLGLEELENPLLSALTAEP
jgi:hypothetical protein